jgi:hypothetical protein
MHWLNDRRIALRFGSTYRFALRFWDREGGIWGKSTQAAFSQFDQCWRMPIPKGNLVDETIPERFSLPNRLIQ